VSIDKIKTKTYNFCDLGLKHSLQVYRYERNRDAGIQKLPQGNEIQECEKTLNKFDLIDRSRRGGSVVLSGATLAAT